MNKITKGHQKNRMTLAAAVVSAMVMGALSSMTGCGSVSTNAGIEDGRLRIVATTTMLADLAENIGGEAVSVQGLMGPGIDPHLYQASAGDVTKMQGADVVLYNGVHLEGKMGDIFSSLDSQNKVTVCIEDGIDKNKLLHSADDENIFDPHIWFYVDIWKEAASYLAERLIEADPDNGAIYEENLRKYLLELEELDGYIKKKADELPENQRVLITAHDAFQYFGNGYGFTVMGLQGISTDAEAGTSDMMSLAEFIANQEIKAVFIESSVPPKTIEALQAAVRARGFDVKIGGELYSDSLGDPGSGTETYILTFKSNIDTIVEALK